jgi:uncharacterized protein (DUF486 family)
MTLAWYGHLKFSNWLNIRNKGLFFIILISWGIAFFEYCLMVPANRLGHSEFGGPLNIWQLKIIQEAISITVFIVFALLFFRTETFRTDYLLGFLFLLLSVYFFFKK